jgi:hypothetical protein
MLALGAHISTRSRHSAVRSSYSHPRMSPMGARPALPRWRSTVWRNDSAARKKRKQHPRSSQQHRGTFVHSLCTARQDRGVFRIRARHRSVEQQFKAQRIAAGNVGRKPASAITSAIRYPQPLSLSSWKRIVMSTHPGPVQVSQLSSYIDPGCAVAVRMRRSSRRAAGGRSTVCKQRVCAAAGKPHSYCRSARGAVLIAPAAVLPALLSLQTAQQRFRRSRRVLHRTGAHLTGHPFCSDFVQRFDKDTDV